MTKGLVRSNNFADLDNKEQAVVNLGLAQADYAALKGLYTTAGIDFAVIGEIGNSQGNYQAQLDGLTTTFSGVALSGYVNRSGNSSIIGNWTHGGGYISVNNGLPSGYPASTDSLFSLSIESGEAVIVASGLVASGLSYNGVRQSNSTVTQASLRNGFSPLHLIPLQVGGQAYFAQAGESPSFYIAPGRTGHALDLITGTVLGGGAVNCASPAWEVGPDGVLYQPAANTPVVGFDPVTLRPRGLRAWGAVTNLCIRSEEIDDSGAWPNGSVTVTANNAVAPNGKTTADLLTVISPAISFIYQIISCSPSTVYTWSFYVKLGTLSAENFRFAIRDDTNGTFIAQDIAPSVTLSTSEWRRVTYTFTTPAGCTLVRPYIYRFGSSATGTFLTWGAQLQTGSTVGPYVPTTGTAASSTADVITITGTDFTRIWNQSADTIYVGWELPNTSSTRDDQILFLADASGLPAVAMRMGFSAGSRRLRYYAQTSAGVFVYAIDGAANSSATGKTAFAFSSLNDSAASENGASVVTDTVGDFSNQTTSQIVLGGTGSAFANGYISELAIWRSRIANTNLQAMTQ